MLEKEIKKILSSGEFASSSAALDKLAKPVRYIQVNHYYDTPDFELHKQGSTLRIRQKEASLALELKYNKVQIGIQSISKEYVQPCSGLTPLLESNAFPKGAVPENKIFNYIGCMITERSDYKLENAVVSLDRSYYLGKSDYELEIEYDDFNSASGLFEILGIDNLKNTGPGKYSRFVSCYKKIFEKPDPLPENK